MLCIIIISSPSHKSQFVQYVLKYKQHVLKYVCSLNYNSLLLLSKKKKTMYWTTTLIFHWVLEKQNKHIKATKIGNHLKPLETIQNHPQNHLQSSRNTCYYLWPPTASQNLNRASSNWSETIHIHLRTPRYYQNYSKTIKDGLVKTSWSFKNNFNAIKP